MIDEVIKEIRTNRISTTEICDALGKKNALENIKILNQGKYIAGKVKYVCTWSESNWPLHEQIQEIEEGVILYVDQFRCNDRAVLGDIVCKQLFTYQNIQGLIVNGLVRDAHRLIKEGYNIWCKGTTPLGCFNKEVHVDEEVNDYITKNKARFSNALITADDSGVVLIESEKIDRKLVENLKKIELQEDIWYYCLDTLKMNSYEIICQKRYLHDNSLLPKNIKDRITYNQLVEGL